MQTIQSLVSKLSEPWSREFQIVAAVVCGLTLGVLVATGGRQF